MTTHQPDETDQPDQPDQPGRMHPSWTTDLMLKQVAGQLLDLIQPGWEASEHLADTPRRYAAWWREFIDYDPGNIDTTFAVEHADQMVAVTGIDTWALCAHHLLPFSARVSIGYLAEERVLGLSKFARITHAAAHQLTSQEQLAATIADEVEKVTGTPDVAVHAAGEHLCMSMRGVRTPATMVTSVARGRFREDERARTEWLTLIRPTS